MSESEVAIKDCRDKFALIPQASQYATMILLLNDFVSGAVEAETRQCEKVVRDAGGGGIREADWLADQILSSRGLK